ncbi:MAG: hypothetical protein IPG50_31960 [Myxococcales bacterium]|nr:hypothetical protein [Myxococcales bacterium]
MTTGLLFDRRSKAQTGFFNGYDCALRDKLNGVGFDLWYPPDSADAVTSESRRRRGIRGVRHGKAHS